jgi:hypothetical protein
MAACFEILPYDLGALIGCCFTNMAQRDYVISPVLIFPDLIHRFAFLCPAGENDVFVSRLTDRSVRILPYSSAFLNEPQTIVSLYDPINGFMTVFFARQHLCLLAEELIKITMELENNTSCK